MTACAYPTGFVAIWDPEQRITERARAWAEGEGGACLPAGSGMLAYGFHSGGAAPRASVEGHRGCIYWGELYNLAAVRDELDRSGVQAGPEAEWVLPAGLDLWGDALFERLEGLFCTVIWDARLGRLVMYRDGSGAKALYFHQGDGWAAVATRLDILVGVPGVPRRVGQSGLHEYLRFLDISPPNTIYEGVRALEPGQPSRFARGLLEEPTARAPVRTGNGSGVAPFEACVDALDGALRASVEQRLEASGATGLFLSGGIDSALICALAASLQRDALEAFTVGFDESRFDEAPVAAAVADHLGIRHHTLEYTNQEYRDAFVEFATRVDLPFADPAALPTLLLFKDCRTRVSAVLDGTGADTLVGVMPARHIRIATQYAAVLPRGMRQAIGQLMRWLPPSSEYASIVDFDAPEDLLIRWKGWSRLEIEALCGGPVCLEETRFFRIYRSHSRRDHFACYSALLGNLPDDRLHQAAELESLQVRFPYWDRQVEELVQQLPQHYRYTDEEPKRLLRALLERYIPRHIWDRPKHGFDFPFIAFLQQDDHDLVKRYLEPARVRRYGIVDTDMVQRYARAFMAGELGLGFRIWALVVLSAWLEHHVESP